MVEGDGLVGELKDGITINIDPNQIGDNIREDIMEAFDVLVEFFKTQQPAQNRKKSEPQNKTGKPKGSDLIDEGAFQGLTMQDVFEKEGLDAVRYLTKSSSEHTQKLAKAFLEEDLNDII